MVTMAIANASFETHISLHPRSKLDGIGEGGGAGWVYIPRKLANYSLDCLALRLDWVPSEEDQNTLEGMCAPIVYPRSLLEPIALFFGVPGNIVTIITCLTMVPLRPASVFLALVSIGDLATLVFGATLMEGNWYTVGYAWHNSRTSRLSNIEYHWSHGVYTLASMLPHYALVVLCAERAAVTWQNQLAAKRIINLKRAKRTCWVIGGVWLLLVPLDMYMSRSLMRRVLLQVEIVFLSAVIPGLIIIAFNIYIVLGLRRRFQRKEISHMNDDVVSEVSQFVSAQENFDDPEGEGAGQEVVADAELEKAVAARKSQKMEKTETVSTETWDEFQKESTGRSHKNFNFNAGGGAPSHCQSQSRGCRCRHTDCNYKDYTRQRTNPSRTMYRCHTNTENKTYRDTKQMTTIHEQSSSEPCTHCACQSDYSYPEASYQRKGWFSQLPVSKSKKSCSEMLQYCRCVEHIGKPDRRYSKNSVGRGREKKIFKSKTKCYEFSDMSCNEKVRKAVKSDGTFDVKDETCDRECRQNGSLLPSYETSKESSHTGNKDYVEIDSVLNKCASFSLSNADRKSQISVSEDDSSMKRHVRRRGHLYCNVNDNAKSTTGESSIATSQQTEETTTASSASRGTQLDRARRDSKVLTIRESKVMKSMLFHEIEARDWLEHQKQQQEQELQQKRLEVQQQQQQHEPEHQRQVYLTPPQIKLRTSESSSKKELGFVGVPDHKSLRDEDDWWLSIVPPHSCTSRLCLIASAMFLVLIWPLTVITLAYHVFRGIYHEQSVKNPVQMVYLVFMYEVFAWVATLNNAVKLYVYLAVSSRFRQHFFTMILRRRSPIQIVNRLSEGNRKSTSWRRSYDTRYSRRGTLQFRKSAAGWTVSSGTPIPSELLQRSRLGLSSMQSSTDSIFKHTTQSQTSVAPPTRPLRSGYTLEVSPGPDRSFSSAIF